MLHGSGYVHVDAAYWGRNWGILLAIDDLTGAVLYLEFIRHETVEDYRTAIASIENRGYCIKGIIVDGMRSLFSEFARYPMQMCHFHMISIIRRYLTKNPRLKAARELKRVVFTITGTDKESFVREYLKRKSDYADTINRRSGLQPLHSQEASHGNAQCGFLSAVPVYVPAGGLCRNA